MFRKIDMCKLTNYFQRMKLKSPGRSISPRFAAATPSKSRE